MQACLSCAVSCSTSSPANTAVGIQSISNEKSVAAFSWRIGVILRVSDMGMEPSSNVLRQTDGKRPRQA